jgi:hypothetical protein
MLKKFMDLPVTKGDLIAVAIFVVGLYVMVKTTKELIEDRKFNKNLQRRLKKT